MADFSDFLLVNVTIKEGEMESDKVSEFYVKLFINTFEICLSGSVNEKCLSIPEVGSHSLQRAANVALILKTPTFLAES